jgi:hypothetical protein
MHCPYCCAHYSWGEACFCLPPMKETMLEVASKVTGVWGEAMAVWSLEGAKPEAGEPAAA